MPVISRGRRLSRWLTLPALLLLLSTLSWNWWQAQRPLPAMAPGNFGAEVTAGSAGRNGRAFAAPARSVGASWIRYNAVFWSKVEPTAPVRDGAGWQHAYEQSGYAVPDAEIGALSRAGISSLVILRGTPSWAVDRRVAAALPPGQHTGCMPIDPEQVKHFVAFVEHTVRRYAAAPYRVHTWEIWNEPDAARQAMPATEMPFGCWGDRDDTEFYGGEAYGRMLRQVYDAIKRVDPRATVVLGGLILTGDDSDPAGGGTDPNGTGRFLRGVLHALYPDGRFDPGVDRPAFDWVAFHGYSYWLDPATPATGGRMMDWDLFVFDHDERRWKPNPLSVQRKAAYLREVLGAYGLDPPLLYNEGALLCYRCERPPPGFLEAQANHVVRMYVRAWGAGMQGAAWYALNDTGWQQSGLHSREAPRPGLVALRTLVEQLGGASFVGPAGAEPVEGYRFRRGEREILVFWTNDSTISAPVELAGGSVQVFDRTGADVTARVWDGQRLMAGFEPLIMVRE